MFIRRAGNLVFTGLNAITGWPTLNIQRLRPEAPMTHDLIYPMFAMVMLTFIVGVITLKTRVRDARSGKMDVRYFKTFSFGEPTEAVLKTQRHFINLFEIPTLFYAGCLAGMIVGVGGVLPLVFAWLFILSRIAHAWIHIGSNKIFPRMGAFLSGFACVLALWICVLVRTLQISA
jgi:hypothetical protein